MPSLGCHAEHCGHLGQTACAMRWGMWSWNERVELFLFSIILYFSVSSAVVQNIWQGSGALGYLSGCKRLQMEGCCTENYTVCLCLGLCSNCNAFIVVRQFKKKKTVCSSHPHWWLTVVCFLNRGLALVSICVYYGFCLLRQGLAIYLRQFVNSLCSPG